MSIHMSRNYAMVSFVEFLRNWPLKYVALLWALDPTPDNFSSLIGVEVQVLEEVKVKIFFLFKWSHRPY